MKNDNPDLSVGKLGECRVRSPMTGVHFIGGDEHVLYHSRLSEVESFLSAGKRPP